jgi:hypothetical protein
MNDLQKLASKAINEMIIAKEKSGHVVPVETSNSRACRNCVFDKECTPKIDRVCMAHNRPDGRSIYYTILNDKK